MPQLEYGRTVVVLWAHSKLKQKDSKDVQCATQH